MTEIRHVVFDIGKVMVRWDPEIPYRRLIPDDAERRRFLAEICTPAWNAEQDRGRAWTEAEAMLIAEYPDEAEMIRAFRANWPEMVPDYIEDSVATLETLLDAGWDVTALTNFAGDTFDVARQRFPFLDSFRGTTVSGRIGLIKPDRAIYDHHATAFDLNPGATLFFDDTMANVEGARAAGWHAELFMDADGLRADLKRYGVLAD